MRKKSISNCGRLAVLLVAVTSAHGQSYELGPLVGGRFGGGFNLEQQAAPNFHVDLGDSFSWGLAGGIRFDQDECLDCGNVQFRWMRNSTHLMTPQNAFSQSSVSSFRANVTLDYLLGDFTHEFPLEQNSAIRPFVSATLGAVRMSAPASAATRFVFGFGTGFKVFPSPRWGFRVTAEYLGIVLYASLQQLTCAGGSCIVVVNGGVTNQFQLSIGPAFRF